MDFYGPFSSRLNSYSIACAISMGETNYASSKKGTILTDPKSGALVEEIIGIMPEDEFTEIKPLFDEKSYYVSIRNNLFGIIEGSEDYPERNVFFSKFLNTAISAYVSPGCIIFNSGIIDLKKWGYSKQMLKKNPKDALEILLTTTGAIQENKLKGYMKSVTKALEKLVNDQNQLLVDVSNKQTPEDFKHLTEYAIHHLTIMPTLIALIYCSCFPQCDSKSTDVFEDLIEYFPEEAFLFSPVINNHLLNTSMFNTKGILENNGGKISLDYVRMVALILIAPEVYINLRVLIAEEKKFRTGELSLEQFQYAIAFLYADTGLVSRQMKGKYNCNVYITTKEKHCPNCNRWLKYTLWAGYVSMRFGYDILGSILKVPISESATLDLDDKLNLKRKEFLAKYEATFVKYDEKGELAESSEILFKELLKYVTLLKHVAQNSPFKICGSYFNQNIEIIRKSVPEVSALLN